MKTLTLAFALVATLATASSAHDTWIMCTPPAIKSGAAVSLHVTSGMAFPVYETAPEAD